jgi:hypothetical protein
LHGVPEEVREIMFDAASDCAAALLVLRPQPAHRRLVSSQGEYAPFATVAQQSIVSQKTMRLTERWLIYGGLYIAVVVASCALGARGVPILLTGPLGLFAAIFCMYVVYGLLTNFLSDAGVAAAQSQVYPTWFVVADRVGWCLALGTVAFINVSLSFLIVRAVKQRRQRLART